MLYFNWQDDFSVGVDLFDAHHRKLIDLINELHEAIEQGNGLEQVKNSITELTRYTKYHFAEEERLMQKEQYPKLEAHIQEHDYFIQQVDGFITGLNAHNATISLDVMHFLKNWLISHIQKTDKKYTNIFKLNEVA